MTHDEILALCNKTPDVGSVKHADFIDYIVVVESRRKVNGEWQSVENAYLTVDGKLAMANADHRKQSKRLDFAEPKVLIDNAEQLTLQVTVTSEVYGTRHGIATSRKKDGTPAERSFNWEVAETSAIGRALAAMGYGLLPGAGLASADAERMLRTQAGNEQSDKRGNGNGHPVCSVHHVALQMHGKGWAHQLKNGSWCYGNTSRVSSPPPSPVVDKNANPQTKAA
jgi:hypothetical protein